MSSADDRYVVGGLVRGLQVLRCFDREHPSLSLGDVARLLGWRRTEPFRFLHTLESLGYLRRDPATKRYALAPKVLEIGFAALSNLELPEMAQPFLERLRDRTNGSAHLGIFDGREVIYVGRAASRAIIGSNINIGSRLPAHATAIGKALLAGKSDAFVREWIAQSRLVAYTATTLADPDAFLADLAQIRRRGYAVSNQEFEAGVASVAAPVRDATGEPVAAINVSAPSGQFTASFLAETVIPAVADAAAELSSACGYRPAPAVTAATRSRA